MGSGFWVMGSEFKIVSDVSDRSDLSD